MNDPSVAALVERARGGDADAFGALFERFRRDLQGLCTRLLGSPDEAQDAVHESFLRAQRAFGDYDAARPLRPWLLTIASHHSLDRLRRRQNERRLFEPAEADALPVAASTPSPLQGQLDDELRRRVQNAIGALPSRYRAPLVLRYYADLEYDAIAEILEVSRGQVGSLLYRGRVLLRETLREDAP